ncbi:MAG TPA: hypothetical protein VFJ97_08270 [Dermatophilaceae bacterium]|nr:hypothetical protein [Dermatophilaceae bacterium]
MRGGLTRWGIAWRAVVTVLVVAAVVDGTWHGNDTRWPFTPMSQFSFNVNPESEIRSRYLEADTVDGRLVRVELSPGGLGVERSEIEGQLPSLVREPWRLQAIAVAHVRRQPGQARYAAVHLRERVTDLTGGVAGESVVNTLATWPVVQPANPPEIP